MYLIECEINDHLKKLCKIETMRNKSNIGIAAAITSKARIKLYKAQQDVIKNGGRLLYSDTDSIFASYKKSVINEQHGEVFWDPNNKETLINDAVFINPKTYGLKFSDREVIKIKGMNNSIISFNSLKNNFYNNKDMSIEEFNYIEKKSLELIEKKIPKKFDLTNYDKRIFIENKKKTKPLTYENYTYR